MNQKHSLCEKRLEINWKETKRKALSLAKDKSVLISSNRNEFELNQWIFHLFFFFFVIARNEINNLSNWTRCRCPLFRSFKTPRRAVSSNKIHFTIESDEKLTHVDEKYSRSCAKAVTHLCAHTKGQLHGREIYFDFRSEFVYFLLLFIFKLFLSR